MEGRCPATSCPDGTFPVNGVCQGQQPVGATYDTGTHMDTGLIVTGSVILGVGYLTSAVLGGLFDNFILFIPVAGGFIHAPLNGTAEGIALGVSLSSVQVAGLVILIVGLASNHPNEPRRADLEPELVPGPGEAGLGLRWSF